MEVTSVSPSATSPTEGDDFCEIDVTTVAIHSVTLLICLCGLVGNGAVLCLLRRKVFNNVFLIMAFFDFLFLLFTVPSALLFLVEDLSCTLIMPLLYLSFLFQLSVLPYHSALLFLMLASRAVYLDILYNICGHFELPLHLSQFMFLVQVWAAFALLAVIDVFTFLCYFLKQEHCRSALISTNTVILLLFVAPMVITHTIKFIKAKRGSREQQPKRRDIVIFILVLFVALLSLCNFLQQLGYIVLSSQVVFLLNYIHSSIKPFIYFLAGRCWRPCSVGSLRLSLQRIFDEPEENTGRRRSATAQTLV